MGSLNTKQQTRKNDTNKIKDEIVSKRVNQIKEVSENYTKIQNDNSEIVKYNGNVDNLLNDILPNTMQIAEEQIKRKGRNLTKHDLVAIIIALEPQQANKIYELNSLKIDDLNFIIRTIIYNPDRYNPNIDNTTLYTPSAPPLYTPSSPLLIEAVRIVEDKNVTYV
jgi:hypothetical protein